ncbi:MAG TPA: methyltransferase domain-containing protein [Candidatus Sumerlaeota bacterium]|nr:methyltransferase domain-containing protein [Candidatus Sumerlaeota bacterium]
MTRSNAEGMKSYWDEKIDWWAESSYEEKPRGPLERWMASLRRSVHARAVIALELLEPFIKDKVVLDVGCGNGHFAKCCAELGAKHVIGTDISPTAVEIARKLAKANGVGDRTTFEVARAGEPLPPSDVVTGFGLVDWLEREECLRFFRNIKDRTFMFSYSDQDGSFDEIIHHFYLVERLRLFGGGVRAYHHPRATIEGRLRKCNITNFEIVSRKEMRFGRLVHNLPTAKRNRTTRNG